MADPALELVEEHLAMCDWCRDYLDQIETTAAAVAGTPARRAARRDAAGARRRLPLGVVEPRRSAVIAYKFLCAGAIGPFSGHRWPLPGDAAPGPWVAAAGGEPALCHGAVHACRVRDLPWWLQDELWEAELDGDVTAGRHKIMAPRARLLRRVDGWDAACSQRFGDACAGRAREHADAALERAAASAARIPQGMAGDAATRARSGAAIVAAYIAAHAAAQLGGAEAMEAERAWQSAWLRSQLALRV